MNGHAKTNGEPAINAPVNGEGEATSEDHETEISIEEQLQLQGKLTSVAETKEWQNTIEGVVRNVVSIHFAQTCSFDTDPALTSEATGFVVDAERGYILTNRHVVGAGPFWGYVIFDNHEECDVYPVYRDPVHDFGILRFNPKDIKYMPLTELKLRPDLAKVGVEIRVVGNDAGEKLSILSGVISRLDRNAPEYGDGYSDFNTNYIQAAASASGGSSGSPVVAIDGSCIALQAGGRADGAATDYFLPLDRPKRALELIQAGQPVTRGTVQLQWVIKPFDECRRLGLSSEWEVAIRKEFPKETGMLVAEVILPEGPSHKKVQEGDVLIKVSGELLTQFTRLDAILDDRVGHSIEILVQRGGQDFEVTLDIGDLHAITPDNFVSVAGGSFHNLSYQQARLYAIAVKGVFVCEAGGSFRFDGSENGWLIQSVDSKETPDLDAFVEVMKGIPDRDRVVVKYKHLRDLHTQNTGIFLIDRHWASKMRLATRNDMTGKWDFKELADALPQKTPEARAATFVRMEGMKSEAAANIIRSFVRVSAVMPVKLDGFPRARKVGYGLVVDAEKGLVVVSRAVIPYDLCDISITIADSIIVDGKVLFLHPLQGYAVVQYDPSLVKAPVQTARLATKSLTMGAEPIFFGFNQNYKPVSMKTVITDQTTVAIPSSASTPRYRAINLDALTVDTSLATQCATGAMLAEDGTVEAFWMTYLGERSGHGKDVEYHLGMSTHHLKPVIDKLRAGIKPNLRILNVETATTSISQARIMGLSEGWIQRVETEDPERHQIFIVRKVDCDHVDGLLEADILLTLNKKLVTRVDDLDVMYEHDVLEAVVLRNREEKTIQVPTVPTSDLDTSRAVVFCGAILHRPHHAVRQQITKLHSGIYISGRVRGSPASMYGLAPTQFITAVNGVDTPDLDAFVKEANKIPDNTYFRLKVVTFDNVPWVATMKKNEHYFPTMEYQKSDRQEDEKRNGWRRIIHAKGHGEDEPLQSDVVDQGVGEEGA